MSNDWTAIEQSLNNEWQLIRSFFFLLSSDWTTIVKSSFSRFQARDCFRVIKRLFNDYSTIIQRLISDWSAIDLSSHRSFKYRFTTTDKRITKMKETATEDKQNWEFRFSLWLYHYIMIVHNFDQINAFLRRSLAALNFSINCLNFVFNIFILTCKFFICLIKVLFVCSKAILTNEIDDLMKMRRANIKTSTTTLICFITSSSNVFARHFLLRNQSIDKCLKLSIYIWNERDSTNKRRDERCKITKVIEIDDLAIAKMIKTDCEKNQKTKKMITRWRLKKKTWKKKRKTFHEKNLRIRITSVSVVQK